MFCHRCGNRLPEDSAFCNRCGVRLRSTTERVRNSRPFDDLSSPAASPSRASGRYAGGNAASRYVENEEIEEDDQDLDLHEFDEWEDGEQTAESDDWTEYEDDEEAADYASVAEAPPYRGPRETVIFSINPAFYPVTSAYIVSTFVSLLLAAVVSFLDLGFLIAVGGVVISFIPSVIRHIQHVHTIFTLTNVKLEISEGLFSKTTRNIPLRHIQDVSVRETFKERVLGIGDIILDTPSMETRLRLNNVNNPRHYADLIIEQLEKWI